MNVLVTRVGLVLVVALMAAGCSGATASPAVPTEVPATETSAAPESTATVPATEAPAAVPTEAPTETQPAADATATSPRERVSFSWAAGSVTPADADDVTEIINDLKANPGILGGSGDETVVNVQYDPTLITLEEIEALFEQIGHPVERQ